MKKLFIIAWAGLLLSTPLVVFGASISPSLIELEGEQEELLESSISIINTESTDQTYYLDTLMFTANDETGSPQFISKDQEHSGLATWIEFSADVVTVPAGSKGEVPFEVFVPDTAEAGGYYAAITVSNAPEDVVATNGAIIEAKTAVLILLSVAGDQTVAAELLDFTQTESASRSLIEGAYQYRVQNQGDVHILPVGSILLKDVFGRTLASIDANTSKGRVLPGTTRTYEAEIESSAQGWIETTSEQMQSMAIGPISAVLSLEYTEGQTLNAQIDAFWIIPWQLISTLIGILILLMLVYRVGRRKSKR